MSLVAGRARKFALPVALLVATSVAILSPTATHRQVAAANAPTPLWTAGIDGGVRSLRGGSYGRVGPKALDAPVISMAGSPTGKGYWLAALDGGVFAFGDASYYGGMAGKHLNAPVVGITADATGKGYWLVATDGGVFAFGDASYYGGMAGKHLAEPVVAITKTPTGKGYYLVGRDGGVFAFGDAHFAGSVAGSHARGPISTLAATPSGNGYWMLARDGDVFAFGDAVLYGTATGGTSPKVAIVPTSTGNGYWIASSDGDVRNFGDASAVAAKKVARPVAGLATPWASSSGFAIVLIEQLADHPDPGILWPARGEVALTFDDGPGPDTPAMLAMLEYLRVPATFFVVGYEVVENPSLLRREVRDGDAVEDHTWDHRDLTRLSPGAFDGELLRTADAIESATGVVPQCFRPPFGSTDEKVVAAAAKLHLHQTLWNSVPNDYELPGSGVITARVLARAHGQGLVVGMHDGGGPRQQTIAALPAIVAGLRARGYRFIRLCRGP